MHKLQSYALVKRFHDELNYADRIECLRPFLINILALYGGRTADQIQLDVSYTYNIYISKNIINILLDNLTVDKCVIKQGETYYLTTKGRTTFKKFSGYYITIIESVDNLITDIYKYFKLNVDTNLAKDDTLDIVLEFINDNLKVLQNMKNAETIKNMVSGTNVEQISRERYFKPLIKYTIDLDKNSGNYSIFADIFSGAVMAIFFSTYYDENNKLDIFPEKLDVYLDSNIIFCELGLHYPEFCQHIKDLLDLLRNYTNISLKIFDFTLAEVQRVLMACATTKNLYIKNLKVNSICSYLGTLNIELEPKDVNRLVTRIRDKLIKTHISIVDTEMDPFSESFKPDMTLLSELRSEKSLQNTKAALHDIAAITMIKELRGNNSITKLEFSKAVFLTSDIALFKFNYKYSGNNRIPEVISDRLFSNIIWLNDPKLSKPLEPFMQRDTFISKDVAQEFTNILTNLNQQGKVAHKDIYAYLYYEFANEYLNKHNYHLENVKDITTESTLYDINDKLNLLKKNPMLYKYSIMTAKQKEEEEKMKELIENYLRVIRYAILCIGIILEFLVYYIYSDEKIIIIIALVLVFLSGVGPFKKIWIGITNHIYEHKTSLFKLWGGLD
jgi:hypothetical protein